MRSASAEYPADTARLVFCFTGEGGVFRNTVIFRVVGEPRIVFPADMGDGRWNLSEENDRVQMIAGLGGRERLRFVIEKNVGAIEKELEEQKRRIESVDWQFTEYKRKIDSGTETIL